SASSRLPSHATTRTSRRSRGSARRSSSATRTTCSPSSAPRERAKTRSRTTIRPLRSRRKNDAPRLPRRRRIRKLRLLALLAVLTLLSAVAFTFGLVRAISSELPQLDPAKLQKREVNGAIYDSQGKRVLAVLRGSEARTLIPSDGPNDLSPWMRHAIVDVEDKRFWEHKGVDLRGIARAAWADLRHKGVVEGGSTIAQQFVKNALVNDQRTIARKVREAALAWQLSQRWSKDRILTAYLNTI